MVKTNSFRYLTFDCYGTLIDWKSGIEEGLKRAFGNELRVSGKDLLDAYIRVESKEESTYKKYREVLRDTCRVLGKEMGLVVDPRKAEEFASSVPRWPAFDDTSRALKELGRKGYKRYILSNVDSDLLKLTIEKQGLEVDGFVTAEETKSYKPSPGHWLRFMEKTAATKGDILHVAQSLYHDIEPAQKLGIQTAWVNRYSERLPRQLAPLFVTDTLWHLAEII